MAKSLKIQIEMAGAEEIKRQLEGVGEAGEEAFNKIVKAAQNAGSFKELDPSFLKQAFDELGTKAPEAIGKITQAVKSASRMETLINALTSVENSLGAVQKAGTAVDVALGQQLVRSLTIVARLLPAAFGAATIGMIVSTTKSVLELDGAAIQLGLSIGELDKARQIFIGIGMDAKTAVQGVADFFEKMKLDKVKEAIAALDEFGRPLRTNIDALRILRDAINETGPAADLARAALKKFGLLDLTKLSDSARAIDDIKKSSRGLSQQLLDMLTVFEKMGDTAERNRLIFETFGKTFGTAIIQMLNAGISVADIVKNLEKLRAKTQETANAATRLEFAWNRLKAMFTGDDMSATQLDAIAKTLNFIREVAEAVGRVPFIAGTMNMGNTLRELETIGFVLTRIGQIARNIWDGFLEAASAAIQTVLQFFAQMPEQIAKIFSGLGEIWDSIAQSAGQAVQTILEFFGQLPAQIASFFASLDLWNGIVQSAQAAVGMIGQSFSQLVSTIVSYITSLGPGLWDSIVQSAQTAWQTIISYIKSAINKVKEFLGFGGANPAAVTGGGPPRMARGGMIGGRGSGTSDSNLAWLSRGEHVMPARAVAAPGVLAFLEALRRSGGNLRGVLDRMGHFAMGGMVSAPAFASGGAVSGMSNVTIQFPGVQPITGLRASSAVVDELRRSAALAQVRSGGRKPSRYT